MRSHEKAKRRVGAIYSWAADSVYDRVVVRGSFRIFGGDFNDALLGLAEKAGKEAGDRPLLDMPVGTAVFTERAARSSRGIVVGCDLAEGMVRKASSVGEREGLSNLLVVQGDAHRLPFPSSTFPVVLCFNGLQVIPDLGRTISELIRVLAPGGRLYVAAMSLGVSGFLPPRLAEHMPNLLSSHMKTIQSLEAAGASVDRAETYRLGYVIEARCDGATPSEASLR